MPAAFLQPGQPKAAVATTATPTASATLAVAMTARSNATTEVSARIAQTTQMEGSEMANMAALAHVIMMGHKWDTSAGDWT